MKWGVEGVGDKGDGSSGGDDSGDGDDEGEGDVTAVLRSTVKVWSHWVP